MSRKPVDLAAVRAAEERIERRLADKPELRERAGAMFSGELPYIEEQKPMATGRTAQTPVNLRLPEAMLLRCDAMISRLTKAGAPELATLPNVTRSDVLRLALLRGLDVLDGEYPAQPELPGLKA